MDKEYCLNTGVQPPSPHFEPTMQPWNSYHSAVPATQELNCSSDQSRSCFLASWDKQCDHFPLTLNSMVPSSYSVATSDASVLRQLIKKLGPAYHSSVEPFSTTHTFAAAGAPHTSTSNTTTSDVTPLNSRVPIVDQIADKNMRNSVPLNPALPSLPTDPGFAERAAKFSCFGSRSFNDRTSQFVGANNVEVPYRSATPTLGNGRLPRVVSSPSLLKQGPYPIENKNFSQFPMEMSADAGCGLVLPVDSDQRMNNLTAHGSNSTEECSLCQQVPSGETDLKTPSQLNSRKRKVVARGKVKENTSPINPYKVTDDDDGEKNVKRSKPTEPNVSESASVKTTSEPELENDDNKTGDGKANQKPPEPPKDYIHVRARRGQATDSHSLAERVRREKISERMKLLQDLVPGCNKVTGKALMLDEIINYVQSLQRQVEFLSMKLASVNPRLDTMDNLLSKDIFQTNPSLPCLLLPVNSSERGLYKNQHQQNPQLQNNTSVDQVNNPAPCHNTGLQLPHLDGFNCLPQFLPLSEDDLHSIVQMGYGQEAAFQSQILQVANQTSHMKIEL